MLKFGHSLPFSYGRYAKTQLQQLHYENEQQQ